MGMLKIGGLASGLDTDGLIRQLLSVERRPFTLLEKRTEKLGTEMNAWRDLNSRMLNLQNRLADLKSLSTQVWEAKRAVVADQTVLTATATSAAVPGTYAVEVVTLALGATWQSGRSDIADPGAALGLSGTIRVAGGPADGETFAVDAGHSLHDVASTINKESGRLGMTASVLQVNPGDYRLVLTGQTGQANQFALEDATGSVATDLMLDSGSAVSVGTAQDGVIRVNNVEITIAGNTVKEAIPGVTLTLNKAGATTNVTVARDEQKLIDAVKGFIDQYNSTIDFIEQQTKYDSKANSTGALFGQGMVQSIQSSLNLRVTNPVGGLPGEFQTLSMVGIATERFTEGSKASGKLKFDEATFKESLAKDPEAIRQLFTADDGGNKGVAVRLEEWLQGYTRSGGLVLSKAGSLESEISRMKERVTRFEEVYLPMKEQRLRNQFIALEKAMSTFQGQGDWLSMQINSLSTANRR